MVDVRQACGFRIHRHCCRGFFQFFTRFEAAARAQLFQIRHGLLIQPVVGVVGIGDQRPVGLRRLGRLGRLGTGRRLRVGRRIARWHVCGRGLRRRCRRRPGRIDLIRRPRRLSGVCGSVGRCRRWSARGFLTGIDPQRRQRIPAGLAVHFQPPLFLILANCRFGLVAEVACGRQRLALRIANARSVQRFLQAPDAIATFFLDQQGIGNAAALRLARRGLAALGLAGSVRVAAERAVGLGRAHAAGDVLLILATHLIERRADFGRRNRRAVAGRIAVVDAAAGAWIGHAGELARQCELCALQSLCAAGFAGDIGPDLRALLVDQIVGEHPFLKLRREPRIAIDAQRIDAFLEGAGNHLIFADREQTVGVVARQILAAHHFAHRHLREVDLCPVRIAGTAAVIGTVTALAA